MSEHLREQWKLAQKRGVNESDWPTIIASWASTQPWKASREDIESGAHPGLTVGDARGTEEASFEYGRGIVLKPTYFNFDERARRTILYHEAGHALESRYMLADYQRLGVSNPLDITIDWDVSMLGVNYSEVLAQAYAELWADPSFLDEGDKVRVRDLVVAMAREQGFPLPSGVKTAMPQSWRPVTERWWPHGHDVVVMTDVRRRRRHYEVYVLGTYIGGRERLDDAKRLAEDYAGFALDWVQEAAPPQEVTHYFFGPTVEFTEPVTYYRAALPQFIVSSLSGDG